MAVWAGGVVLLVGLGVLLQAVRADSAVRRWTHTRGTISQATKAHLTDDGRQWWNVLVAYRSDSGEEHAGWVRQIARNVDQRTGEPVDVWYDPRRPDRLHATLAGGSPGGSWMQYLFGAVFAVAGAAVLLWALR